MGDYLGQTSGRPSDKSNFPGLLFNLPRPSWGYLRGRALITHRALQGKPLWPASVGYNPFSCKCPNPAPTRRGRRRRKERKRWRRAGSRERRTGGGSGGDSQLCSRDALRANFTDLRNNWVQALNVIDSFPLSLSSPPCSAFPWVDIVLK